MDDNQKSCNPEIISRFFDGELEADEYAAVTDHLEICPVCREKLANIQSISERVKEHIAEASIKDTEKLEDRIIEAVRRIESPWWAKWKDLIYSKRFLVPAGAVASFLLIFFTVFYNPAVSGPSAIITSISGSGTSVIIMETPETRQTILWFNEKG